MNRRKFPHYRNAESGQSMLEYVLIVVFVALAGTVAWRAFGEQIRDLIGGSAQMIENETDQVEGLSDAIEEYRKK